MKYTIARVRDLGGNLLEERVGRRGSIDRIELGERMSFHYVEGHGRLVTSPVEAYSPAEWEGAGSIVVQTEDRIYVFKKGAII